jgi:hypothetical protein
VPARARLSIFSDLGAVEGKKRKEKTLLVVVTELSC